MKVQQLMTRATWTCRPADGLDAAARIMRDQSCGSVVVVDEQGKPVAMLTDRDVCLCALRTLRPLQLLRVSDAMSRRLHACGPEDPVADAEATMALRQVRRLPVVDPHGVLIGVLSLDDIARVALRDVDLGDPSVTTDEVGKTLGAVSRWRIAVDPPAP